MQTVPRVPEGSLQPERFLGVARQVPPTTKNREELSKRSKQAQGDCLGCNNE